MRVVKLFELYTLDLLFSFYIICKNYLCLFRLQLSLSSACFRLLLLQAQLFFVGKNYCVITDLHGKEHIPPEIISRRGSPAAGDKSRVVGRRGVVPGHPETLQGVRGHRTGQGPTHPGLRIIVRPARQLFSTTSYPR